MQAVYENHYLSDKDVANFARQSFGKLAENFTEDQNNNLIRFLARGMAKGDWENLVDRLFDLGKIDYATPENSPMERENRQKAKELMTYLRSIPEHWVPFGHPHISIRMQAPVPIARQAFKHKIGFVESEESRRYVSSRPVYFVPEYFRARADNVKQGSADQAVTFSSFFYAPSFPDDSSKVGFTNTNDPVKIYTGHCEHSIRLYERFLNEGVCPEQARFILPQGVEVNWLWTGSLYAYANFYNQRSDSHAQKEIQELAEQINQIIAPLYPVSWAALTQGDY